MKNSQEQSIGVCVIVLDKAKKRVLLGKRRNGYKAGMYGLPGGRLEFGESISDCGKRELLEETGLRVGTLKYIGVVREVQESYNFVHFVFVCKEYAGTVQNIEPEKCEDWEWLSLTKVPQNILKGHREGLKIFLNNNSIAFKDLYK